VFIFVSACGSEVINLDTIDNSNSIVNGLEQNSEEHINIINKEIGHPISNGDSVDAEHKVSYDIFFISSKDILNKESFYWAEEFVFDIIQVENLRNDDLEKKINKSIIEAMTHWIKGQVIECEPMLLEVFLQNDRYLSFGSLLNLEGSRADSMVDFITIDMETGQRIVLNDLVEVSEELAYRIFNWPDIEVLTEWRRGKNHYEFLEEIEMASLTQDEVYKHTETGRRYRQVSDIEETLEPLLFRTSFFLEENQVVLVFQQDGGVSNSALEFPYIVIHLDDIEDFLKVEKWR